MFGAGGSPLRKFLKKNLRSVDRLAVRPAFGWSEESSWCSRALLIIALTARLLPSVARFIWRRSCSFKPSTSERLPRPRKSTSEVWRLKSGIGFRIVSSSAVFLFVCLFRLVSFSEPLCRYQGCFGFTVPQSCNHGLLFQPASLLRFRPRSLKTDWLKHRGHQNNKRQSRFKGTVPVFFTSVCGAAKYWSS